MTVAFDVAVPVAVMETLLVPSVCTISVSLSVPVCVGANVMIIVQVPCGWTTTTTTVGMQVPDALKSGELAVITPVKPRGPRPVLVTVMGEDCAVWPMATGFAKGTVAAAGEGVPGGALSVCNSVRIGCTDGAGSDVGPVVSKNAISKGEITYPVSAPLFAPCRTAKWPLAATVKFTVPMLSSKKRSPPVWLSSSVTVSAVPPEPTTAIPEKSLIDAEVVSSWPKTTLPPPENDEEKGPPT